jgi:hypothetical protein
LPTKIQPFCLTRISPSVQMPMDSLLSLMHTRITQRDEAQPYVQEKCGSYSSCFASGMQKSRSGAGVLAEKAIELSKVMM